MSDLREEGTPVEVAQGLAKILVNEARVVLRPAEDEGESGGEGKSEGEDKTARRRVVRSQSQEAVRAESQKDAGALLQLTAVHPALAERQVDRARLEKLYADAQALSGRLSTRVVRKAEAQDAPKAVRNAATVQRRSIL